MVAQLGGELRTGVYGVGREGVAAGLSAGTPVYQWPAAAG